MTKFGTNKLDKYLSILVQVGLIRVVQIRDEHGRFAQSDMCILNGSKFNINNLDENAPYIKNHSTDIHSTVTRSYTKNINTKKNKENIKKLSCASEEDARASFEEKFWAHHPRKKNKTRALRIWIKNKLHEKADLIEAKLLEHLREDVQWQDPQFIPHPSTLLNGEFWEDEVTKASPRRPKPTGSAFSDWAAEKTSEGRTYDEYSRSVTFDS